MRNATTLLFVALIAFSCNSGKTEKEPAPAKNDTVPGTAVNKPDNMKVDNSTVPKTTLTLSPQEVSGNLGQVTFSQNNKTVFFYNLKTKKGTIVLNGTPQTLDKYSFDSKTFSYSLSGGTVTVTAPNGKFKENKGEDCGYGKFAMVNITMGTDTLNVNDVEVQDCPDY